MALKLLLCLSFAALVLGHDFIVDEDRQKLVDDCAKENKLSEEDVHEFAKELTGATPEIKDFFLCVTQKLGTFDGESWNVEKIKAVVKDEERMKKVEECLAKDDKSLEPADRNFAVVLCTLEKEPFL